MDRKRTRRYVLIAAIVIGAAHAILIAYATFIVYGVVLMFGRTYSGTVKTIAEVPLIGHNLSPLVSTDDVTYEVWDHYRMYSVWISGTTSQANIEAFCAARGIEAYPYGRPYDYSKMVHAPGFGAYFSKDHLFAWGDADNECGDWMLRWEPSNGHFTMHLSGQRNIRCLDQHDIHKNAGGPGET